MGLFDWIGGAVNKIVSPVVGTLGSGIGTATGATGLGDASAASIAAQERMHAQDLEFEREKLEAIQKASTVGVPVSQSGTGTVSPLASRPTSETAKKPLSPVLIGLAIAGFFLFKKKRGKL